MRNRKWIPILFIGGIAAALVYTYHMIQASNELKALSPFQSANAVVLSAFATPGADIEDLPTNAFTRHLEQILHISFKFEISTSDNSKETKQVMMADGDYPDIFLSGGFSSAEQLKYGTQGILIPLNELIDQYGPEITKAFQKIPRLRESITAPDGNIYALPSYNECFHCWYGQKLWMNKKWLDQLHLQVPTTTEELYEVLTAFKNQDPNGNGLLDEIPLVGASNEWHTRITGFLMSAFIYNNDQDYFYMKNGKVGLAAAQPEWREGLRFIHKLYQEGLIDPRSFTQNIDGLFSLASQPANIIGSVTAGHIGMAFDTKDGVGRHLEYVTVPPLIGPEGYQAAGYFNSVEDGQFAITDKATREQAVAAIKLANYLYTEEAALLNEWGPENIWWRKGRPGELDEHGRPAKYYLEPSVWGNRVQNLKWSQMGILFRDRDLRESWAVTGPPSAGGNYEHRLYTETAANYEGKEPKELFPLNLFMDSNEAIDAAHYREQINQYIESNMVQFITGSKNLDEDWEIYIQDFERLKLDRYLEIYQKAYDKTH